MQPNVYFLCRVWRDSGRMQIEIHSFRFFQPELSLNLQPGHRTTEDWWEESMHENLFYNPDSFVPDGLEICEEPLWLGVIGHYSASGWKDYWGEYDEDFEFEILAWAADVEGNNEDERLDK